MKLGSLYGEANRDVGQVRKLSVKAGRGQLCAMTSASGRLQRPCGHMNVYAGFSAFPLLSALSMAFFTILGTR